MRVVVLMNGSRRLLGESRDWKRLVTVENVVELVLVEGNEDEVGGVLCAASVAAFQGQGSRKEPRGKSKTVRTCLPPQ